MKKIIFLFPFLILINACSFFGKRPIDPTGRWRFYDVSFVEKGKINKATFEDEATLKRSLETSHIISFFKDNTFSELNGDGKYINGTANFTLDQQVVNFNVNGKAYKNQIVLEKNREGKDLLIIVDQSSNVAQKFIKECDAMELISDEPFAAENNTWRLKPNQKEDSLAIATRLKSYIKHLALVLKSAKTNSSTVISFEFSRGPAKIYNGAIGVEPFEKVEPEWLNCFYDEGDCRKSYAIFEYVMTFKKKYKGAYSADWVEVDYNILLDIYSRFGN